MSAARRRIRKFQTIYRRAERIARKKIQSGKIDTTLIPRGSYCYDERGCCPYWDCRNGNPQFTGGYCGLSETWDGGSLFDLLWDQVRTPICGRLLPEIPEPKEELLT